VTIIVQKPIPVSQWIGPLAKNCMNGDADEIFVDARLDLEGFARW
jgi:hypothetical protein